MRIVLAPDSFKGSLSATAAADAMERGVRAVFPLAEVVKVPIADGGEGTVAALVGATRGRIERRAVRGPLGEPVQAEWGVLGDGRTAVIEMAAASGLLLVPPEHRDPRRATTFGTGELVRAALDAGLTRLVVGIGGSATNDGGAGMARALGVRFLDAAGNELDDGGAELARLERIDLGRLDPRVASCEILVACDVQNPLTGPDGASAVYGPQKGAGPSVIQELDAALARYARVAEAATGRAVAQVPGAGAAGGLGAGFLLFTPARLRRGVDIVLEISGFAAQLDGADLVITGEGRTDRQSGMGKAPMGVAAEARRHGVPVICLSGALDDGCETLLDGGVDALASTVPGPMGLEECMARAPELLETAAAGVCRLVRLGTSMRARQ